MSPNGLYFWGMTAAFIVLFTVLLLVTASRLPRPGYREHTDAPRQWSGWAELAFASALVIAGAVVVVVF